MSATKSLVLILMLATDAWMTTAAAATNSAIVRTVRGDVLVSTNGVGSTTPKPGTKLWQGGWVKTGSDGATDLFLNQNGPILRLREKTEIVVDRLDYENTGVETVIKTRIRLVKGRILGNVKKMAAESSYQIGFPKGVIEVRGTEFDVSADGVATCISGGLQVTYFGKNGHRTEPVFLSDGMTSHPPGFRRLKAGKHQFD